MKTLAQYIIEFNAKIGVSTSDLEKSFTDKLNTLSDSLTTLSNSLTTNYLSKDDLNNKLSTSYYTKSDVDNKLMTTTNNINASTKSDIDSLKLSLNGAFMTAEDAKNQFVAKNDFNNALKDLNDTANKIKAYQNVLSHMIYVTTNAFSEGTTYKIDSSNELGTLLASTALVNGSVILSGSQFYSINKTSDAEFTLVKILITDVSNAITTQNVPVGNHSGNIWIS